MDDEISETVQQQEAVFEVFESARDPVLTTEEVAEGLRISVDEADTRLSNMEANGMVQRKQEVWWTTPAPYLEMEATALLHPPDVREPLSVAQIREVVCDE